jgi:hypothetical protein
MGIYSISGNYSPLYSLSNGIFILWSFLTNLNILATKVGKKGSNPILGTWCGRGLNSSFSVKLLIIFLRNSQSPNTLVKCKKIFSYTTEIIIFSYNVICGCVRQRILSCQRILSLHDNRNGFPLGSYTGQFNDYMNAYESICW